MSSILKVFPAKEKFVLRGRIIEYTLVAKLGSGAFGVVYHAKINSSINEKSKDLAVKWLHTKMLTDEKRIQNLFDQLMTKKLRKVLELRHDHLVEYFAAYVRPSRLTIETSKIVLIMEYANGGSLETYIHSKILTLFEIVKLSSQILSGLAYLHSNGLFHTDLKPSNILVFERAWSKILKIGDLDEVAPMEGSRSVSNDVEEERGTACYFSPEMADKYMKAHGYSVPKSDVGQVGSKTDVWSFGCILNDMIRGHQTHKLVNMNNGSELMLGKSVTSEKVIQFIQSGGTPIIDVKACRALTSVVSECLRWNPDHRPKPEEILLRWKINGVLLSFRMESFTFDEIETKLRPTSIDENTSSDGGTTFNWSGVSGGWMQVIITRTKKAWQVKLGGSRVWSLIRNVISEMVKLNKDHPLEVTIDAMIFCANDINDLQDGLSTMARNIIQLNVILINRSFGHEVLDAIANANMTNLLHLQLYRCDHLHKRVPAGFPNLRAVQIYGDHVNIERDAFEENRLLQHIYVSNSVQRMNPWLSEYLRSNPSLLTEKKKGEIFEFHANGCHYFSEEMPSTNLLQLMQCC